MPYLDIHVSDEQMQRINAMVEYHEAKDAKQIIRYAIAVYEHLTELQRNACIVPSNQIALRP